MNKILSQFSIWFLKKVDTKSIVLDIKMPEMDGFELRRQIKKIDNAAKVCFLTASELYYEEFRKELGLEEPVIDKDLFLRKPIQNEELIKEITRIINSN